MYMFNNMELSQFGRMLFGLGGPVFVSGLSHYFCKHLHNYQFNNGRIIPVNTKTSPALTDRKIRSYVCEYGGDYSKYFD